MEVRLAGGALIDIATAEDVKAGHDRIAKLLERPHARFYRAFGGKAPRAANLPFVIPLQQTGPPGGMMWLLQWAIFIGDDPTQITAIANARAALFIGNAPPDSSLAGAAPVTGQLDPAGCVLPGVAIPSITAIPDKSVAYSGEQVYGIIAGTGTVAGAVSYRLILGVIELPQTAEALMW